MTNSIDQSLYGLAVSFLNHKNRPSVDTIRRSLIDMGFDEACVDEVLDLIKKEKLIVNENNNSKEAIDPESLFKNRINIKDLLGAINEADRTALNADINNKLYAISQPLQFHRWNGSSEKESKIRNAHEMRDAVIAFTYIINVLDECMSTYGYIDASLNSLREQAEIAKTSYDYLALTKAIEVSNNNAALFESLNILSHIDEVIMADDVYSALKAFNDDYKCICPVLESVTAELDGENTSPIIDAMSFTADVRNIITIAKKDGDDLYFGYEGKTYAVTLNGVERTPSMDEQFNTVNDAFSILYCENGIYKYLDKFHINPETLHIFVNDKEISKDASDNDINIALIEAGYGTYDNTIVRSKLATIIKNQDMIVEIPGIMIENKGNNIFIIKNEKEDYENSWVILDNTTDEDYVEEFESVQSLIKFIIRLYNIDITEAIDKYNIEEVEKMINIRTQMQAAKTVETPAAAPAAKKKDTTTFKSTETKDIVEAITRTYDILVKSNIDGDAVEKAVSSLNNLYKFAINENLGITDLEKNVTLVAYIDNLMSDDDIKELPSQMFESLISTIHKATATSDYDVLNYAINIKRNYAKMLESYRLTSKFENTVLEAADVYSALKSFLIEEGQMFPALVKEAKDLVKEFEDGEEVIYDKLSYEKNVNGIITVAQEYDGKTNFYYKGKVFQIMDGQAPKQVVSNSSEFNKVVNALKMMEMDEEGNMRMGELWISANTLNVMIGDEQVSTETPIDDIDLMLQAKHVISIGDNTRRTNIFNLIQYQDLLTFMEGILIKHNGTETFILEIDGQYYVLTSQNGVSDVEIGLYSNPVDIVDVLKVDQGIDISSVFAKDVEDRDMNESLKAELTNELKTLCESRTALLAKKNEIPAAAYDTYKELVATVNDQISTIELQLSKL